MSSAAPRIMGPLQLAKKHLAQQYLLGKEIAVTFLKMPQFPNVSYHILYSAIYPITTKDLLRYLYKPIHGISIPKLNAYKLR